MPSHDSAEGKAQQRARNGSNRGSTGDTVLFARTYNRWREQSDHRLEWEDIKDDMEHVIDVVCSIQHAQVGGKDGVMTFTIPREFVPEAIQAAVFMGGQLGFMRMYMTSLDALSTDGHAIVNDVNNFEGGGSMIVDGG